MSMLRDATNEDSVAGVVAAGLAGVAWGVGIWLFDRWWGERPSVRPVSAQLGLELCRRLPTTGLLLLGFVASYVVWRRVGAAYGFAFEFSMGPVYIALVAPIHTRRRYVRRDLRAGLVEPTR